MSRMITGAGRVRLGEDTVEIKFTVPEGPCAAEALLPGARALATDVAALGEARVRRQGLRISCTKGCGACCRQLVPISPTEARALAALVASLPPERATVRAGDCLLIVCTNRQAPEIRQTVDAAGDITLPWVGRLHVAGLTLREAGELVGKAFRPTWPPDPRFTVARCR